MKKIFQEEAENAPSTRVSLKISQKIYSTSILNLMSIKVLHYVSCHDLYVYITDVTFSIKFFVTVIQDTSTDGTIVDSSIDFDADAIKRSIRSLAQQLSQAERDKVCFVF